MEGQTYDTKILLEGLRCSDCKWFYSRNGCAENPELTADTAACSQIETFQKNVDQKKEEFNRKVWETARKVASTVIRKDEKYHGAYRRLRQICKIKYGDPTIPYFVHVTEKRLRQGEILFDMPTDDQIVDFVLDDEDAQLDEFGYRLLEIVCRELDDGRQDDV